MDADYSQIELRVLAHISNDAAMIEDFKNDEDIHAGTASRVFQVPREMVSKSMRSDAKAVNFGIVFGISDFSLANDIGVSVSQAKQYIDEYFEKYAGVRKYMTDIVEQCRKNGYVTTILNRRRYFPEINASNFNIRSFNERAAINTPVQGSAADIIKLAMVKIHDRLREMNLQSRLILQVHDELVIEVLKSELDTVRSLVEDCMTNAISLSVPLKVDINVGESWYDAK
jgi:DNA polymerase-1